MKGYKMHSWNGKDNFPPVITVFSAPNYCGIHGNEGAVLITKGSDFDVKTFTENNNQPFLIPDYNPFVDGFTYFHADLLKHSV